MVEVAVVVTEVVATAVVVLRFLLLFLQSIDLSYKSQHGHEG